MDNKNFWIISLCFFFILAANVGWNFFLRIAVIANSAVILFDIFKRIGDILNERKKENAHFNRG